MSATKPLVLQANAFLKMINWMGQFANFTTIPQGNWVEAMGIMFCKETPQKYIIVEAEGITSGNLVYVETSPQQIAQITQIEANLQKDDPSVFAGGWFHSHPGHSLFYSGTDISNQSYWQTGNPNGVGLVFDLTQVSQSFIGFKFFRLDPNSPQSYYEVPYELYGFTEDTLMQAYKPIGIDIKTIHRLAKSLGLRTTEGIVEFEKIKVPETDDPVGEAKKAAERAEEFYLKGNSNKAIEQYRIANLLLKDVNDSDFFELYVDITLKLTKLCVLYDFPDTAKLLINDVKLLTKKYGLNPDLYIGKTEILLGYQADLNDRPEDALFHYKKAIDLFKQAKFYPGLYEAQDLAGGASWKFLNKQDALKYFKDSLYSVLMAQKMDKTGKSETVWELIKSGLSAKIESAESELNQAGIEQV